MFIIRLSVARPALAVALVLASACSSTSTVGSRDGFVPSGPAAAGTTTAQMRIIVPARSAPSSAQRRPAYVSPATTSVGVQLTPAGGRTQVGFAQGLTPGSPGCVASASSSLTCTLQLPGLAPGSYTASIGTFDGPLAGGVPSGNVLSENENFPVTIMAGVANTIPVILDGVPAAIAFVPGPRSSLVGSPTGNYGIAACTASETPGTETASVITTDADGNLSDPVLRR